MHPSAESPMARRGRDPVSYAALLVALIALVAALHGEAQGRPQAHASSNQAGKTSSANLKVRCPKSNATVLGSWCLESSPHTIPAEDIGKNNYFYAAQTCVREGGWLPTAAQLIGAAPEVPLQSTLNDDPGTSGAEEFPNASRGITDKREMSSDLFTTAAGSEAAGSEGVTAGARGNTTTGEPDPVPMPANPEPETLDYVTVYDNGNHGGFAGGEAVGQPESFRCAYAVGSQVHPKPSRTN